MLLWIVLSTVGELTNPQPLIVLEDEPEAIEFDPRLPVIEQGGELIRWLGDNRMNLSAAERSVNDFRGWLDTRGYPVDAQWISEASPSLPAFSAPLPADNDAELIALAGAGNARAAMMLGDRSVQDDPLAALEWFDQAIVNGSIWAMVRTANLLTSLGDPALAGFQRNSVWQQSLDMINAQAPPLEQALGWHIAAVIAGGYIVLDKSQADQLKQLSGRLDAAQIDNACELAQGYVLDTAMARRAQGGAVFSTERPLFATSVAAPEDLLPCSVPVQPLIDMSDCITEPFVGPGTQLWQMYFCPTR